ncbi:MFS transporter (plasmid) [Pararhizobium polonicum]|uniref:MFS transporter n=1 Tax=Pararhizobium polonicum TaxID=1612624 RepID=A0A1C7P8D2_9HYPH|nr:MFS transporter [Pararhizobium polonicum]OBZ97555.1 MFS transporter [Pararhizobium polonicum]
MKTKGKWKVLAGGFFSYTFDAMDLVLLALCLRPIMLELDLSPAEGGFLATATMIGVALSAILGGWFSDNYGRRVAMLVSLISFSILTMLIAATSNYWEIFVLRFLAGLGLGGIWGVIAAYIAETWPPHQRGRAAAFALSSFPIGVALASMFVGLIVPEYGWRMVFLTGGLALFVAIYIYFFVPESEVWLEQRRQRIEARERGTLDASRVTIAEIFSPELRRNSILGAIVAGLALSAYWGTTTWLPTYLVEERGLSVSDMGTFMTILSVGMFIGYQIFGLIADLIGKRLALIITLFGCAVTLPMYAIATDRTVLLWLGPLYAFFVAWVGLFGSYFAEIYPAHVRATGSGFCFNVGRGISAFAPVLFGGLAQLVSLQLALGLCGVLFLASGIVMIFMPNSERLAIARQPDKTDNLASSSLPVRP